MPHGKDQDPGPQTFRTYTGQMDRPPKDQTEATNHKKRSQKPEVVRLPPGANHGANLSEEEKQAREEIVINGEPYFIENNFKPDTTGFLPPAHTRENFYRNGKLGRLGDWY